MRCYFDGSTGEDDNGSTWLTLAGYMAPDRVWIDFERKWEAMLRSRYPVAPWLHMWQLMAHEDPFERVNGWTNDKIYNLVDDALNVFQNLDKRRFRAFVYTINVTARDTLVAEGYSIPAPSIICAHSCIRASFKWFIENHDLEEAFIFYDRDEQFFRPMRHEWLLQRDPKKRIAPGNIWGLISDMREVDMWTTAAVQAADLIAWACTRELSERTRPLRYLATVARAIIPFTQFRLDKE